MSDRLKKGLSLELEFSRKIHSQGVAVLIDAQILRERGAGQVDLCRWFPHLIEVFEVKSFGVMPPKQYSRLLKSCTFLSQIFNAAPVLKLLGGKGPSLKS